MLTLGCVSEVACEANCRSQGCVQAARGEPPGFPGSGLRVHRLMQRGRCPGSFGRLEPGFKEVPLFTLD